MDDKGVVVPIVPAFVIEDLLASGLETRDMRVRLSGPAEKQATNTAIGVDAYTIPYFDMDGRVLQFYRNKLCANNLDPDIKYKQVAAEGNHIYFPLGFKGLVDRMLSRAYKGPKYILITEGEKKAAKAVKEGFPCVGLSGVDSWRNRQVKFDKNAQLGQTGKGEVTVKIAPGAEITEQAEGLALGMREVINFGVRNGFTLIIVFDSDLDVRGHIKYEVQRAAATLGYEMRNRGVPFKAIRHMILQGDPTDESHPQTGKLGLDDYLVHEELGPDALRQAIHDCMAARQAFPRHPNPREYVARKLQATNIARNAMAALGTAIICDLDSNGMRLHCADDDNMYYFDMGTHRLMKAHFSENMAFAKTGFGRKLYESYGVTYADSRLTNVLVTQFSAEQPIEPVTPEKVMAVRGDTFYYQLNDGHMVKVDSSGIRIILNGTDNVLFEGDMVDEIEPEDMRRALTKVSGGATMENWWYETLQESRFKETFDDRLRKLLSLLYSISPWMYRWRATQLPLEQMLGEAGSGKSTNYKLRQLIISGRPKLRNAPATLKDWAASVASAGAIHVTDNVHMTGGPLKQQLSDELCRCITEDDPKIEARKLYTDNDLVEIPVRTVFAVTAIKQPFTNVDIIQRSIIAELDKGTGLVQYDASWAERQISRRGGRVMWMAHQLTFLHRLFKMIRTDWDSDYKAKFRLINMEQLFHFAARIYGMESDWVVDFLERERNETTAKSDAVIEGLIRWADFMRDTFATDYLKREWTTANISDWMETHDSAEEFSKNPILTNPRALGHYIEDKKNTLAQIVGIAPTGYKKANRKMYKLLELDD